MTSDRGQLAAGIDLYLPESGGSGRDALDGLAQSVMLSTFMPAFYLLFEAGIPFATVQWASEALDVMGAEWIGLLHMDQSIFTVRRARKRPIPDRTPLYQSLRRKLASGRGRIHL